MNIKGFLKIVLTDPSLWLLLLSNLLTIFLAVKDGWGLSNIIWIYWLQSVIIGLFNFLKILELKQFSTEGFKINGQPVQPTRETKILTAAFFLFHFGLFHLVYLIFILAGAYVDFGGQSDKVDLGNIALGAGVFFISHLFSYFYHRSREDQVHNIGSLMMKPYARIIPMHLTLIGTFLGMTLILFFVLKTFADCLMHIAEHVPLQKGSFKLSLSSTTGHQFTQDL